MPPLLPWHALFLLVLILGTIMTAAATATTHSLQDLPRIGCAHSSVKGVLNVTLALQVSTHTLVIPTKSDGDSSTSTTTTVQLTTRTLNGTLPGPTLCVYPGDWLVVTFVNQLPTTQHGNNNNNNNTNTVFVNNHLSAPHETNLHFHGLHVSGELPSDDTVAMVLEPGESYTYQTRLPPQHMPGTHWMHPHRHGSSMLHVGGGAVAALIVMDPPNYLPPWLQNIPEEVLVVHPMTVDLLTKAADQMNDDVFRVEPIMEWQNEDDQHTTNHHTTIPNDFLVVNGETQLPLVLHMSQPMLRLRVVHAGWKQGTLDLQWSNQTNHPCRMALLAKDGIYIRDVPRWIQMAQIPPGGRADLLIACSSVTNTADVALETNDPQPGTRIALVRTNHDHRNRTSTIAVPLLPPWTPDYPDYLTSLLSTRPSPGCTCTTRLGKNAVNGYAFDQEQYLHHTYLGAVVERRLDARSHPYHQHVYPFQIISGFGSNGSDEHGYLQAGDWHDTLLENGVVRYRPTRFTGKVMLHCHRLEHEDLGMMAMEYVHANRSEHHHGCTCTPVLHSNNKTTIHTPWVMGLVIGGGVAIALVFVAILLVIWRRRRRRYRDHEPIPEVITATRNEEEEDTDP